MTKPTERRTWILVADSSRAKLYEVKEQEDPTLLEELEHRQSREQGQDLMGNRPNAIQHSGEAPTHARHSPNSVQSVEVERFARELAARLEKARNENAVDELVVSAPPQLLGELRNHFSKSLLERVVRTEPKRWVDARPDELRRELID